MKVLTPKELEAKKVRELGLDPAQVGLSSPEAIAGALRRAAGFLCPCSPTTLIRAVLRPLEGVVSNLDGVRERVEDILDAVVAVGDLQEHSDIDQDTSQPRQGRLLYPSPPTFVVRQSGAVILLGITPDRSSPLPDELEDQIQYKLHVRRLPVEASTNPSTELRRLGLIELAHEKWLQPPPKETCQEHVSRLATALGTAPPSGEVPGLTLLEPTRPVTFYRGRWAEVRKQTGRFVGRRSQAYGADLWCFVDVAEGHPRRFVYFPLRGSRSRGCDEAWHLQAAIDADRGEPQRFRVRRLSGQSTALDFFSPVPMWAQRRWDAIGEPLAADGCLFSYGFSPDEIDEEIAFARERLWLAELPTTARK